MTDFHLNTSRFLIEERFLNESININRATAVFYNENDFAFFLSLIFPLFLVKTIYNERKVSKLFNISFLLLLLLIVVINDSKLVLISIIIQFIVLLFIVKKSYLFRSISCVVLILGAIYLIQNPSNIANFVFMYTQIQEGFGSAFIRLNLYLGGFEILADSYFLGVGPKNYSEYIIHSDRFTGGITNPHSWLIEIMSDYGIFIFGYYLFLYITTLNRVYKICTSIYVNQQVKVISLGIFLSMVGFTISSFSSSGIMYQFGYWLYMAFVLAFVNNNTILLKEENSSLNQNNKSYYAAKKIIQST
ncbi:O-antigen ligase family protein [bacterium LRH843]|nr:O-antigen ligase family protein [bacterium LRH843]